MTDSRARSLQFLAALAVLTAAVLLRGLFDPLLGDRLALVTLYGAVAFAVWIGGLGPAILTTILGYLAADYLFIEPRHGIELASPTHLLGLFGYLLSCGIIIFFGEALRQAQRTAQARAREAGRQREQLSVTLASIGDAVIATDREGRVTFLNHVAAELTGWKQDEAMGEPLAAVFRIVNEHTGQPVENPAERALATGRIVGLANHTVLIAKDGAERPIDDSAAPIRDDDGTVSGVILVFRDVTERRRQQIAARQLAAIVESSADAIIGNDLNGTITSWNPAAQHLYGFSAEEMIGKPKSLLIPADRQGELPAAIERIRCGERVAPYETVRVRKDGSLMDVSITVSPIRDEEGEIAGAATIARDITERKRSEAALREADRRKDEFLATLAHELRNPMAPLSNALQALRLAGSDPALIEQAHGMMERQLSHLVRLVDDLLDVSRITTGKIELRRERVELRTIVDSALETSRPLIDRSGHRISVTLPNEPLVLYADPTRMAQVLSNLLNNAAKYTDRGGRVALAVRQEGDQAVITVEDDGIGIAPEVLPRLFEIFSQADPSRERAQGGLGIGLSLVRGLVEMHGGSVGVHSDGLGRGSRFTVRLPLAPADGAIAGKAVRPEQKLPGGRRVLVVDDNRDSADSMTLLLGLKGHSVRTAYDGSQAIEEARSFHPDLVLLDIGLPGLDGYEVARRLRAETGLDATLVATTGWGHVEDKRRASEAGFDFHLTKPVSIEALERFLSGQDGDPAAAAG
jgi:PAS domain S-box-containing protein